MKKRAPGDLMKISAQEWNEIVDAVRWYKEHSINRTVPPVGSGMPLGLKGDLLQHNGSRYVRLVAPTTAFLETDSPGVPVPAMPIFMPDTMLWEVGLTTEDCG